MAKIPRRKAVGRSRRSGPTGRPAAAAVPPERPLDHSAEAPLELAAVLHDLRVRQAELEAQNEALRRACADLESANARLTDLVGRDPVGYVLTNTYEAILDANETAADLLAVPRRELRRKRLTSFIVEEDRDSYDRCRVRVLAGAAGTSGRTRQPQSCEVRMRRADGETFLALVTVTVGQQVHGSVSFQVAISDVTDLRLTGHNLQLFKSVFDRSSEACAISDAAGRLVYINAAHTNLFGRTLEEAQLLNYRDFYPAESVEVLNRVVAPLLAKGRSWEGELDAIGIGGRRFPLWERADSILGAGGQLLYAFGFMHDLTEVKHAMNVAHEQSEELRRQNSQLSRLNRLTVGREARMIELKQEINTLCRALGQPERYGTDAANRLADGRSAASARSLDPARSQ